MTDQTAQPGLESKPQAGDVSRRSLFRAAGVGAAVVGGRQAVANANISNYTLFEIAYKAFTSVNDPHNPATGVVITPPVGIQWQKGTKYPLEAVVVDNTLLPQAKITGDLLPTFK